MAAGCRHPQGLAERIKPTPRSPVELLGGSADLTIEPTNWSAPGAISTAAKVGYIHYGVREFGMCAIMNGIALHGGFIPYGATFLMFSDYARNAIRMAALMQTPVIVFTHDPSAWARMARPTSRWSRFPPLRLIPTWTSGVPATP